RGDLLALQDQRPGTDQRPRADAGAVEHDGPHPDQAIVADLAAVEDHPVPDGHAVADARGAALVDVDERQVLEVRALADLDAIRVSAAHRVEPHARVGPDRDLAPHHGAGGDVDARVQRRRPPPNARPGHARPAGMPTNGLVERSTPIVVPGPWPGWARTAS